MRGQRIATTASRPLTCRTINVPARVGVGVKQGLLCPVLGIHQVLLNNSSNFAAIIIIILSLSLLVERTRSPLGAPPAALQHNLDPSQLAENARHRPGRPSLRPWLPPALRSCLYRSLNGRNPLPLLLFRKWKLRTGLVHPPDEAFLSWSCSQRYRGSTVQCFKGQEFAVSAK